MAPGRAPAASMVKASAKLRVEAIVSGEDDPVNVNTTDATLPGYAVQGYFTGTLSPYRYRGQGELLPRGVPEGFLPVTGELQWDPHNVLRTLDSSLFLEPHRPRRPSGSLLRVLSISCRVCSLASRSGDWALATA